MAKPKDLPPRERLLRLFDYDETTGKLYWRWRDDVPAKWNTRWAGKEAGSVGGGGYLQVGIGGRTFMVHRIVWRMVYGDPVPGEIDHRDENKLNNRQRNLRAATRCENERNKGAPRNNTSGYKCVSFDERRGRFQAYIYLRDRQIYLGYFDTPELAAAVHAFFAPLYHGEFARSPEAPDLRDKPEFVEAVLRVACR